MYRKLMAAVALVVAAAVITGMASASRTAALQRIAISFPKGSTDSFVLTPLTSGSIQRDAGSSSACCWTRRFYKRDGQEVEVDNPLKTFVGKLGTFEWRAQVSFVDAGNGYSVSTGTWKIVGGTGAYKHLGGHGRLAGIDNPGDLQGTLHAEGLVSLGG